MPLWELSEWYLTEPDLEKKLTSIGVNVSFSIDDSAVVLKFEKSSS